MKIVTNRGSLEISIEDIPNVEKLTSLDINLQDGTVNFYFEGWVPVAYPTVTEELQGDGSSVALPEAKA